MILSLKNMRSCLLLFLCCGILFATAAGMTSLHSSAEKGGVQLPILMYHHILKDTSKQNKYTISPKEFESDLQYIKENGYKTVTVQNLIDYCENGKALPEKPIMITFDDGYESVYAYAVPLLREYEMCAVVNIIGKYTDLYSESDDHSVNYTHITWEQLKACMEDGTLEVASHTYDMHTNQDGRNGIKKKKSESDSEYRKAITEDLTQLQNRAQEMLGVQPVAFAYPFGQISKETLPILKEIGFKAVFCCWEKVNVLTGDSEELYHLNRFNRPHNTSTKSFFASIEKQMT